MKPTYLLTTACITALLAGCESSSQIYLPDGSSGYKISCKPHFDHQSPAEAQGKCLERAGKTCGDRGYRTIQVGDYHMVIQCNSPTGFTPTSFTPTFVSLPDKRNAAIID